VSALAGIRPLLALMGGAIGVESTAGQDGRIWFTLPSRNGDSPPPAQAALADVRVLVVHPDPTAR
jgi:hypothetical protein